METALIRGHDPGTNFRYPARSLFPQDSLEAAVKMKKILIAGVAIMLLLTGIARSAEISSAEMSGAEVAKLGWNAANIDKLRALDKAAIERFTDIKQGGNELLDFGWFDLAGDGRYELAITYSGGLGPNWLAIYWQDAPGKMRKEGPDSFAGAGTKLSETFMDLNGDGKLELSLYSDLGVGRAAWPQILRLQNGDWVDASREFPRFYDTEVLPQLVSCLVNKFSITDAAFDCRGRLGPAEGFGVFIPLGEVARDRLF